MGLRQSLDEGAGEIGDEIAEEIPSTSTELRETVPDDVTELDAVDGGVSTNGETTTEDGVSTNGGMAEELSIDVVVEDTPLGRFL
jgi:hypothetical protein